MLHPNVFFPLLYVHIDTGGLERWTVIPRYQPEVQQVFLGGVSFIETEIRGLNPAGSKWLDFYMYCTCCYFQ
jgi:hypothetical protein